MSDAPANPESKLGFPARSALLVLLVALAGGAWFSGRGGDLTGQNRYEASGFVGNAACSECHSAIVQSFAGAPHSWTLSTMAQAPLRDRLAGRKFPDPTRDAELEFIESEGRFYVRSDQYARGRPVELQWCFGSGEHAQTFVGVLQQRGGPQWLLQCRLSWYAQTDQLGLTPGEPPIGATAGITSLGQVSDEGQLRRCFGCHSTHWKEEAGIIDFSSIVPGIQCERCHGPRKEHVALGSMGTPQPPVPNLKSMPAIESIRWCGGCHRQDQLVGPMDLDPNNVELARFAPIGLVQSKCFRNSKPDHQPTCFTCHDPHGATKTDPLTYNVQCRRCHGPESASAGVVCKSEPNSENCLPCHMPKVPVGLTTFTDHWIRVRDATQPATPPETHSTAVHP